MPLYEYQCATCHRRTEKIQKFSDAELTVCPHCGGPLERTLTAPNVQFKGGGWYKDLYSSAKPVAAGSGESSGTAASGTSESGGSDAASNSASDGGKATETVKPSSSPASTVAPPAATSSIPATKA